MRCEAGLDAQRRRRRRGWAVTPSRNVTVREVARVWSHPCPLIGNRQRSIPVGQAGALVANVGCGNGKYMRDNRHAILGSDRSRPLALIAGQRVRE